MYAIISDSGRQYKVSEGQILDLDYREAGKGDEIRFEKVLAVSNGDDLKLGAPLVDGAAAVAEVLGVKMGPKLIIRKFRRRKTYRRKQGHRQMHTRVRINTIEGIERKEAPAHESPQDSAPESAENPNVSSDEGASSEASDNS